MKILNLRKPEGELLDAAAIEADWGVRPDQVVDFQSLVGDAVDNIPGVPGVGPKTAAKWLQQFGTLDNLIAHADEAAGGPKTRQALKDAIANGNLAKSRSLVKLDRAVPLKFDWDGWRRKDWDGQRLLELFHEFGFRSFADRVRKTLTNSGATEERRDVLRRPASLASEDVSHRSASETAPAATSERKTRGADAPARRACSTTINEDDSPTPHEGRRCATAPVANDNWSYEGYELIDTAEKFETLPREAQEAEAVRLRPRNDGAQPDLGRDRGLCLLPGNRRSPTTFRCAAQRKMRHSTRPRRSPRSSRSSRTRPSRR